MDCRFTYHAPPWPLRSLIILGRRRFYESGTAIERRRRSPSAEGTSEKRAREGVRPLSLGGGGLGDPSHENFVIKDD